MKCLQCELDAVETGEKHGLKIRECAAGHRTARATKAMVRQSEDWKALSAKAARDGVIDMALGKAA